MSNSWWICSRSHWRGAQVGRPDVQRDVAGELGELPVAQHVGQVLAELVPGLALDLVDPVHQPASEPNSATHLAAVFSPTPGMLGRLSLGSPRSAAKSGYWTGVRPYLAATSSGVNRVISLMPRRVISTVMRSSTSCSTSRSPVTISTSMPACSAWVARVAMMSSASYPGTDSRRMPSASSTSKMRLSWLRKSAGVSRRFALYSTYCSCRKVGSLRSKATATWVGASSRSTLMSIAVKP